MIWTAARLPRLTLFVQMIILTFSLSIAMQLNDGPFKDHPIIVSQLYLIAVLSGCWTLSAYFKILRTNTITASQENNGLLKLIDAQQLLFAQFSTQKQLLRANDAFHHFFNQSELTPLSNSNLQSLLSMIAEGGGQTTLVQSLNDSDEKCRSIRWTGTQSNGSFFICGEDITEDEHLRHQLHEASQQSEDLQLAKEYFLANMSHEIRTPMNGIVASAELLQTSQLNNEQQQLAHAITASSNSLLALVDNVLDYSHLNEESAINAPIEVTMRDLVDELLEFSHTKAASKGLALHGFIPLNYPTSVLVDARLRQVLANLIENAIKFTNEGCISIQIQIRDLSRKTVVTTFKVCDTGEGIANDKQQRIFQSFNQVDNSHTRPHQGTGLGLATCKELVQHLGGDLIVTSDVGMGAEFSFGLELPIVKQAKELHDIGIVMIIDEQDDRRQNLTDMAHTTDALVISAETWDECPLPPPNEQPILLLISSSFGYRANQIVNSLKERIRLNEKSIPSQ